MDERMYEKIYQANVKLVDDNSTLKKDIEILERRIKKAIEYVKEKRNEYGIVQMNDSGIELIEILKGEKMDDKELELS